VTDSEDNKNLQTKRKCS